MTDHDQPSAAAGTTAGARLSEREIEWEREQHRPVTQMANDGSEYLECFWCECMLVLAIDAYRRARLALSLAGSGEG